MSKSKVPVVSDLAREGSNLSSSITNSVTDDLLGFDPGGGGIYDVSRDVLGDTIADDVLGFDPGGGGSVPVTNAIADAVVKYAIGQAVGSVFGGESATAAPIENATFETAAAGTAAETAAMNQALAELSAKAAADAAFVAADTAQLWDQTKSVAAVQQNLIYSGVDPLVAAEAANAAALGMSGADLQNAIMNASQKGASSLYTATPADVKDLATGAIEEAPSGYDVDPMKVAKAAGNLDSLLNPSPSGIPQQSIAGRAGGAVDYSGLLNLLTENRAARQRLSLV
jgi:hypothetical protein